MTLLPPMSPISLSSAAMAKPSQLLGKMQTISVGATAYFFLQKELKLPEHHLTNIMLRYPNIMYLKVDSNLRPTVDVFKSFGFREKDIRQMVGSCPYVLAINHEWTLPEKLISIQKMFNLNRSGLIKIVVSRPYLLMCSIQRNIEVSNCLTDQVTGEGSTCLVCVSQRGSQPPTPTHINAPPHPPSAPPPGGTVAGAHPCDHAGVSEPRDDQRHGHRRLLGCAHRSVRLHRGGGAHHGAQAGTI